MNWSANIGIGGMDRNDFVQQAKSGQMQGVTVTTGNSFSISSSNMSSKKNPGKEFGKEKIDRVVVERGNLVFDGTIVKQAKTPHCIVLKNGAEIENADAGSEIHAENCKSLGKLNAQRAIRLSNCSAIRSFANREIFAENCENVGLLNTHQTIDLINCSFGSASAGRSIKANNCQNFGGIRAMSKVEIENSVVDKVFSCGDVIIRKTTIKETLEFFQTSTIVDSMVESIVVHQNYVSSGITVISGRMKESSISLKIAKIYLENTIVKNITFPYAGSAIEGEVFLLGNSEVQGKVHNGKIVKL